jgi:hypothetical protein
MVAPEITTTTRPVVIITIIVVVVVVFVVVVVVAVAVAGVAAGVAVFSFTSGQRKRITMILLVSKCSLCWHLAQREGALDGRCSCHRLANHPIQGNYATTTTESSLFWAIQERYLQSIEINNSNAPCQFCLGDALLVGYLDGAPC